MQELILNIPHYIYTKISDYLFPSNCNVEEVAFIFASVIEKDGVHKFYFKDYILVPTDGFFIQSPYYFELTNDMRKNIIKTAHDLNCCIVEFHSHLGDYPARFSPSDWSGFNEFIPHVLWRLKSKYYIAIVMTEKSFDALVWIDKFQNIHYLNEININDLSLIPTKLSLESVDYYE